MHEASVAQNLLEVIINTSKEQNARPLHAKISCGQLNTIHQDVFEVAFAAIAEGTVCEGMTFTIDKKPFRAECSQCEHLFPITFSTAVCPQCESDTFQLLPDAPMLLESIEFDEE